MEWIFDRLEKWRLERNLDKSQGFKFDLDTQVSFITEEVTEYLRANNNYERIDALCDITVFCINGLSLLDKERYVFTDHNDLGTKVTDILEECANIFYNSVSFPDYHNIINCIDIARENIKLLGYDFEKCMEETLKEIESRTGAINPKTGKWEKFKTDEAKAKWYKADYSKCKLKG